MPKVTATSPSIHELPGWSRKPPGEARREGIERGALASDSGGGTRDARGGAAHRELLVRKGGTIVNAAFLLMTACMAAPIPLRLLRLRPRLRPPCRSPAIAPAAAAELRPRQLPDLLQRLQRNPVQARRFASGSRHCAQRGGSSCCDSCSSCDSCCEEKEGILHCLMSSSAAATTAAGAFVLQLRAALPARTPLLRWRAESAPKAEPIGCAEGPQGNAQGSGGLSPARRAWSRPASGTRSKLNVHSPGMPSRRWPDPAPRHAIVSRGRVVLGHDPGDSPPVIQSTGKIGCAAILHRFRFQLSCV